MNWFARIAMKSIGAYLNLMSAISPSTGAKHGAFIFCYPMRPGMRPDQRAFLERSLWYRFEFDGNQVSFYRWGRGAKRILMVHGWVSHSFRWKKYIDRIDLNEYTIYAVDAPGHGLTDGNQLNLPKYGKLLNHLLVKLGGVDVLMGHSFGAFNCLYTMYEYETPFIGKAVLLASPGNATDFVDYYINGMGINQNVAELMNARFKRDLGYELSYFSAEKFASEAICPGLIIHDYDDKDTAPKYASQIHANWPNSELYMTRGFGHRLNQPEIINKILDFISRKESIEVDEKMSV